MPTVPSSSFMAQFIGFQSKMSPLNARVVPFFYFLALSPTSTLQSKNHLPLPHHDCPTERLLPSWAIIAQGGYISPLSPALLDAESLL